jgi:hypothetical protein
MGVAQRQCGNPLALNRAKKRRLAKSLRSIAAPPFELEAILDLLDGIRIVPKSHRT